jgi:gliding motility-associated lipoprotein GldH
LFRYFPTYQKLIVSSKLISNCIFALIISQLYSCTSFENKISIQNLKNYEWQKDTLLHFEFDLNQDKSRLNFLYQVQYLPLYPFQNIWLRYILKDPDGKELIRSKDNLFLFDASSGKPLGEYSKNRNYKLAYFLKDVVLTKKGIYTVDIQHYMRPDVLTGIESLGVMIEESE